MNIKAKVGIRDLLSLAFGVILTMSSCSCASNEASSYQVDKLYSEGRKEFNRGDYAAAMSLAMPAYDLAKKRRDELQIAMTAELIADIFSFTHNEKAGLSYSKIAVDSYLKAGEVPNHRYALCDLASTYLALDNYDRAEQLLDSIHSIAVKENKDSMLMVYSLLPLADIYAKEEKFEELRLLYSTLWSYKGFYNPSVKQFVGEAVEEMNLGNMSLARELLVRADSLCDDDMSRLVIKRGYLNYYRLAGDYEKALNQYDSVLNIYDREVGKTLSQSVSIVQRDYYLGKAREESAKSRRMNMIVIATVLAAIFIAILGYIFYKRKIMRKNLEMERYVGEIGSLSAEISEQNRSNEKYSAYIGQLKSSLRRLNMALSEKTTELEEMQRNMNKLEEVVENDGVSAELENLFKERWEILNKLCNEYFETGGGELARISITKEIEREIVKMRGEKQMSAVEASVDRYMDNVMKRLRSQCGFLKDGDFIFIMLIYAGLSPKTVCLLTDNKLKNYYNKKKRLADRIAKSDVPDRDYFVDRLSK